MSPSSVGVQGRWHLAERTRRQAEAVCTGRSARRWSSPVVLTSAHVCAKPDGGRATRHAATRASASVDALSAVVARTGCPTVVSLAYSL
jgi:hypothetical protein